MKKESEELENSIRLDTSRAGEVSPGNPRSESVPDRRIAIEEEFEDEDFEDEDFIDPEEYDEFGYRTHPSRKRIGIFCFNCNRREGQFLFRQNRWYYSYLIGLTFGLIKIVGPYQCQCCGARRLMCSDWISLQYLLRRYRDRKVSRSKKGNFKEL